MESRTNWVFFETDFLLKFVVDFVKKVVILMWSGCGSGILEVTDML
jgi:hypothetical protein